jgi:prolyl-tRNA synthetase
MFSQTLREDPTDVEVASHQLMVRAGYIHPLAAGIFSYLPLARRAMTKIETILREEINAIGGQEITMPVVNPAEVWQQTGRWYQIGTEMGRFKDKNGHDMVLAMTHEEVVADLARSEIRSYRQLPQLVYHIQTKWRDDPRPRAGLIRVREFTMLDSYSLDASWPGLDQQYQAHYDAYFKIFQRCGLPVVAVKADTGMMGGKLAHEYMYLTPIGEDTLLFCDQCGYAANRQVARYRRPEAAPEPLQPLEKVATPHTSTIDDLAIFLNVPASKTAKAVFMIAAYEKATQPMERFVFAVVRGDSEVNEYKLANVLSQALASPVTGLRPATDAEIAAIGAVAGYASPLGLKPGPAWMTVVDEAIPSSPNLVAGANETGFHLLNTNYGRDYTAAVVADIAAAGDHAACPDCGAAMRVSRGVEVGNIFKLGTRYTEAMGVNFVDEEGQSQPVIMGSYGIGVGRLLACVAEEHHDEHGLCWPVSVAPYPITLVRLSGKSGNPDIAAEELYQALCSAGMEPLFDDRPSSPGEKFMDADLMGMPLRITVSDRGLKQGCVEFKPRQGGEAFLVPIEQAIARAREMLASF